MSVWCGVGPGTPCGNFMRRYWQPALLASEIPDNDGPQVRVRLLGEDLIAFRATDGSVGLVDAYCPHRRAPLFFGRNEECGIRCAYHGWKFDVNGDCVDMPSEPAGTPLQGKVKLKAYPTVERGGVIWTYMGPPELKPEPPNYEWFRAPITHRKVSKTFENCNYLQAMEGGLDTAHSSFAHNNRIGDKRQMRNRDRAPRIDIDRTNYGYWYSSTRTVDSENNYVRLYHFAMPHFQIRGAFRKLTGELHDVPRLEGHNWVRSTMKRPMFIIGPYGYDESVPITPEAWEKLESLAGRGEEHMIPGTFRLMRNLSNDFLINREVQKTSTLHWHRGRQYARFCIAGRHGPDHRSHEGVSRHVRPRDHIDAAAAAGEHRRCRARRRAAWPRSAGKRRHQRM
ncbi:MAG: Rieske 2Fe-2S domain-containing protein [Alphaproteobacteria bacterium]